jgi:VWFA-related protein
MSLFMALAMTTSTVWVQAQSQADKQSAPQNQQDIPDAPSPQAAPPEPPHHPTADDQQNDDQKNGGQRPQGQPGPSSPPPNQVPTKGSTIPPTGNPPAGQAQDPNWPGPNEPEPGSAGPGSTGPGSTGSNGPDSTPGPNEAAPGEKPPSNVNTVPEGGATGEKGGAQEQLYKIVKNVNQVMLPVRVTDGSGRMVNGLLSRDFAVYEDGKKQALNYFTGDPLAVSVAVVFDLGMPDVAVQKVNKTFTALEGAFSQYDELSIYTYSSTVGRASGFSAVNRQLEAKLNNLETQRGHNNGPAVTSGPMGPQGPTINGVPEQPGAPIVYTPEKEAHVLNDAILAAALELSKRDKKRRRIIFVISDGREYRSNASYKDVLKLLLTNGIAVYGIAVESSAIPGYNKIERLHLPHMGYSDILPKYASATAGEIYTDFSSSSMEDAYARALGDARNQYTVGYVTRGSLSSAYRQVEVKVARPDVKVYAEDGYYPLPPSR